jgi:mono/diheme cytochrome c family protein
MRRSLFAAPVLATLVLAACSSATASGGANASVAAAPPRPAAATAANIALGDSLYHAGSCQRCHGQKGVGAQNGPSLVTGPWLHSAGDFDAIAATITTGIPRANIKDATRRFQMNPRGGPMNLTDAQVQAVAAYVWSISRDKK